MTASDDNSPAQATDNNQSIVSAQDSKQYIYLPLAAVGADHEVNLLDYWRAIISHKGAIFLIILVFAGPICVYIHLLKPVYVADLSMFSVHGESAGSASDTENKGKTGGGRDTDSSVTLASGSEQEALAILQSRVFSELFINTHNLMPLLFPDNWDSDKQEWTNKDPKEHPDMWDAYQLFNNKIRVLTKDKGTGLNILSIHWNDAKIAAKWANQLVADLNDHLRKRDTAFAQKKLDYLQKEMRRTSVLELKQTLYSLIEQNTRTIMLASVTDEYAMRVIDPAAVPKYQKWTLLKRIILDIAIIMTVLFLACLFALFLDYLKQHKTAQGDTV